MTIVTVHAAKTNFSELLRRVEAGEEIIIARGDKPVAILKNYSLEESARRRKAGRGSWAGKMDPIPDGVFFDPRGETQVSISFPQRFDKRIGELGWRSLPLEFSHAVAGAQLPGKHKDPFDRMLAGQAAVERLTLVTRDAKLKRVGVETVW